MVSPSSGTGALSLRSNDFELFGLPDTFDLDLHVLDLRWKALLKQVHPDQHATQSSADKKLAMQWSVRINEAYQRLKKPIQRAAYLCQLNGFEIQAHQNTSMPADFLVQQMQWRENLDDAETTDDLSLLHEKVLHEKKQLLQQCQEIMDERSEWGRAVELVRALMFIEKFEQDLDRHFARLDID
jgi:molecular chaperone HscB